MLAWQLRRFSLRRDHDSDGACRCKVKISTIHSWRDMMNTMLLMAFLPGVLFGIGSESVFFDQDPQQRMLQLDQQAQDLRTEIKQSFCHRPVLQGTPSMGSNEQLMREILIGDGELKDCIDWIHSHSGPFFDWWENKFGSNTKIRHDSKETNTLVDGVEQEVVSRCAQLGEKIHAAVSFEQSCSPSPTTMGPKRRYMHDLDLGHAIAAMSVELIRANNIRVASELMLDAFAFSQDLRRGSSLFIGLLTSSGLTTFVAPVFAMILHSPNRVDDDLLDAIENKLDLLLRVEPHPSSILRGEFLEDLSFIGLPGFDAASWDKLDNNERLQKVLIGQAAADYDKIRNQVCPANSSPDDCLHGLWQLGQQYAQEVRSKGVKPKKMPNVSDDPSGAYQWLMDKEQLANRVEFISISRYRRAAAWLAALKANVQYVKLARLRHRCPAQEEVEQIIQTINKDFSAPIMALNKIDLEQWEISALNNPDDYQQETPSQLRLVQLQCP
jgi:hypothetical protein